MSESDFGFLSSIPLMTLIGMFKHGILAGLEH
jgi:hypothetical protein